MALKQREGILIVVSGFSGAGKGTVIKELMKNHEDYALSISATTRKPRANEVHGKDYFFLETEEFEKMIANEELIEYARYVENYYGTPKAYVTKQLQEGKDVILEIEIQGALRIKEMFPQALLLFVTPPSAKILKERLLGRGTETLDVVEQRLKRAAKEASYVKEYDYIIINDKLELCVDQLHQIVTSEKERTGRNQDFLQKIQKELEEL